MPEGDPESKSSLSKEADVEGGILKLQGEEGHRRKTHLNGLLPVKGQMRLVAAWGRVSAYLFPVVGSARVSRREMARDLHPHRPFWLPCLICEEAVLIDEQHLNSSSRRKRDGGFRKGEN